MNEHEYIRRVAHKRAQIQGYHVSIALNFNDAELCSQLRRDIDHAEAEIALFKKRYLQYEDFQDRLEEAQSVTVLLRGGITEAI